MATTKVWKNDIVETIIDIYLDGVLIPSGTKYLWEETTQLIPLAGFGRHLVQGVDVQNIKTYEIITLPLECLKLCNDQ